MPGSLTEGLAAFAAAVRYDQLPPEAVRAVKRILLDTAGCALAGSRLGTGVQELLALVETSGGSPECSVIGTSIRVPAVTAALANGGIAHALNYDDFLSAAGVHLGVTGVPAALAAAELRRNVTGRELIAAVAAGSELMARLGFAIQAEAGAYTETRPQLTQMLGYFNAAASAGRVSGLSASQMQSALGVAFMHCSGGRQPVLEGTPAKALYAAFPSQGGTLSALLALRGLGAECAALEGPAGLFATYFGNRWSEAELVNGLGQTWRFAGVAFKPWPTTSVAHAFIEAAISLGTEQSLRPEDVKRIHLRGGPHVRTFCEPSATRQAPRSPVEAEDSVPFAVAKALANRQVTLADLQPAGLSQPEALQLASRVTYAVEEDLGGAGIVEVATASGQTLTARVDRALGNPPRELTDEQLEAKFRDCAQHALEPVAVDKAVALIWRLEEVDDVGLLTRALSVR